MNYNPQYLNNTHILNDKTKQRLDEISSGFSLKEFLNANGLVEKLGFDFVYSSSQIEGNTYSKIDTLCLIEDGITANGKLYSDAKMIVNLRKVYNEILFDNLNINKSTLHTIHETASNELVSSGNSGNMRKSDIQGITGTSYIPLPSGQKLNDEMEFLFSQYKSIDNPFEKAIYLHNNLCYLQYFEDCNKRTARSMQFLSLKNSSIMPLVITEDDKEIYRQYRSSIVEYYDSGNYEKYIQFFIQMYEKEFEFLNKIKQNK